MTDRARNAIDIGASIAWADAQRIVNTDDILIGLIRQGGGGIGDFLLIENGVTEEAVVAAADSMNDVLDISLEELHDEIASAANWFGMRRTVVGEEHVLLAICNLPNCRASRILQTLGFPSVLMCREIIALKGRRHQWEKWLQNNPQLNEQL